MILPGEICSFCHDSHQISATPAIKLHSPKKRSCPSLSWSTCKKVLRHVAGDTKGMKPSTINTSAIASQNVELSKPQSAYFLTLAGAAGTDPRSALKNSELAGSTTMTSLFFEKLTL